MKQMHPRQSKPKARGERTAAADGRASRGRFRWRRILVPLDFSGKSRQALEYAIPLATQYRATISLIHVVEPAYIPGEASFAYLPMNTRSFAEAARTRLRKMAAELVPAGRLDKLIVREGSPFHEIVTAARNLDVDLIVIATQGHTGLSRVLLGSTAERVVRHAHCPVLTVRRR